MSSAVAGRFFSSQWAAPACKQILYDPLYALLAGTVPATVLWYCSNQLLYPEGYCTIRGQNGYFSPRLPPFLAADIPSRYTHTNTDANLTHVNSPSSASSPAKL